MEQILSWEANSRSASEIPRCYGSRRFIIVLKTAHHWSLSWQM